MIRMMWLWTLTIESRSHQNYIPHDTRNVNLPPRLTSPFHPDWSTESNLMHPQDIMPRLFRSKMIYQIKMRSMGFIYYLPPTERVAVLSFDGNLVFASRRYSIRTCSVPFFWERFLLSPVYGDICRCHTRTHSTPVTIRRTITRISIIA